MADRYLCQSGIPAPCRLAILFQAILGYPKAALTGPAADTCMQNGTVSPIFERFKHRRSPKPSIQARNQDRQDIFEAFHGLTVHMRSAESPFIKRGQVRYRISAQGTVWPVGISAVIGRRENKTARQAFCLSGRSGISKVAYT